MISTNRRLTRAATGLIAALATTMIAVPARALTSFATFDSVSPSSVIGYSARTNSLCSIDAYGRCSTPATAAALQARVLFNFLQPGFETFGGFADFILSASSTSTVQSLGAMRILDGFSGSFSFTSTVPITTPLGKTFAAGTNLLTATFTNARLSGRLNSESATLSADQVGVEYTSAIIDSTFSFGNKAISVLLSIPLFGVNTRTQRFYSFEGDAGGSLSSEHIPRMGDFSPTPEPASWAMLIAGFGMTGASLRRRRRLGAAS